MNLASINLTRHYLDLMLFKSYADLRSESSRTYLSFLWWVIDPILSMFVYYVVFGLLLQRGHEDFVPFLLIGLTIWNWFGNTARAGMNTIQQNRQVMNQVYVPKIIFPLITILTNTFKFFIVFFLILAFVWIYGFDITIAYLSLPILLVTQLVLLASVTVLLAAVVPFFPDMKYLINTLLMMTFFLSGIFYSGSSIPAQYQDYFYLNPMANLIENYREVLMYHNWPDWSTLGIIWLVSLTILFVAIAMIDYFDDFYPRTPL